MHSAALSQYSVPVHQRKRGTSVLLQENRLCVVQPDVKVRAESRSAWTSITSHGVLLSASGISGP